MSEVINRSRTENFASAFRVVSVCVELCVTNTTFVFLYFSAVREMAEGRGPPKPSGSNHYTNVVQCRHHPGAPLIEDHAAGDMICQECGLVVGDRSVSLSDFMGKREGALMLTITRPRAAERHVSAHHARIINYPLAP